MVTKPKWNKIHKYKKYVKSIVNIKHPYKSGYISFITDCGICTMMNGLSLKGMAQLTLKYNITLPIIDIIMKPSKFET